MPDLALAVTHHAAKGSVGAALSVVCGLAIILIIFGNWKRPR